MDTLFIIQAAYSAHPVLTVLHGLPLLFFGLLFLFFTLGVASSIFGHPSRGPNAGFGEAVIFLLFLFFGVIVSVMSYPRPTFTDSIGLKASDAQVVQTALVKNYVNESKENDKYVTDLLHRFDNYRDFQTQLGSRIPVGKKVDLKEVNRALSPFFYTCFVMSYINVEKSIYDIKHDIREKEKECSVVATQKLLATMD